MNLTSLLVLFVALLMPITLFAGPALTHWDKINHYLDFDLFYTHDFISNTGGVKSGPRNIGALDVYLESDLSKFSAIKGEFTFHYLHINKTDTRGNIGDAQIASNIDMPHQVDRVPDLWYQHHWSEKFKTLIGLHDISMEFNITTSSLNFLNSSFGTGAEFALTGINGPSIYPLTSLGVRAFYQFNDSLSLRSGLYDADPGSPETYRSFHSDVGSHESYLHISELAHQDKKEKAAIGGWNLTRVQDKLDGENHATSFGAYGIYEKELTSHLWTFFRYGWANPLVSIVQSNLATGVIYKGIFQNETFLDEVGVGMTSAHFSRHHLNHLEAEENSSTSSDETAYEAYYQFRPTGILSLRPDVQYIKNPAGLDSIEDAWAVGFRTVIQI